MNKTLIRAAGLVFVAALALSACSNDEGIATTGPTIEATTPAPEATETVEPTETPAPEETTEAPNPTVTNSALEVIGIEACTPYIEAFTEIGELSASMGDVNQPLVLVESYQKAHALLAGLTPPKGAEADFTTLTNFYGVYAKNLVGVTTTDGVNKAMLKVLSDLTGSGMTLSDGMDAANAAGAWMGKACV